LTLRQAFLFSLRYRLFSPLRSRAFSFSTGRSSPFFFFDV
jgi:hypothetical protein